MDSGSLTPKPKALKRTPFSGRQAGPPPCFSLATGLGVAPGHIYLPWCGLKLIPHLGTGSSSPSTCSPSVLKPCRLHQGLILSPPCLDFFHVIAPLSGPVLSLLLHYCSASKYTCLSQHPPRNSGPLANVFI